MAKERLPHESFFASLSVVSMSFASARAKPHSCFGGVDEKSCGG